MKIYFIDLHGKEHIEPQRSFPDIKVHRANMETTWVLSAPGGPHVGPINLAIMIVIVTCR